MAARRVLPPLRITPAKFGERGQLNLLRLLDDPLLRFTWELETGTCQPFTETVNLAPLFTVTGAVERVRPKLMTVATTLIGLLPVMLGTETGSQVMKRIAAPMVGGVVTSGIMELMVYPVIFYLWRGRKLSKEQKPTSEVELVEH